MAQYKTYLITGGTGFIGSHLAEYILENDPDSRVLLLARGDGGTSRENIYYLFKKYKNRIRFAKIDIRDYDKVKETIKGTNVVFHLASQPNPDRSIIHPRETFEINITGTINVLEACLESSSVEKIVLQSSSEVYGEVVYTPVDENHPLNPTHPYSASKLAAERIAYSYYKTYGLPVTIARPFNTFGPRQKPPAVIPSFIERILENKPIVIHGDGKQARDYVYVKDVVRGLFLLSEKGREGEIYNFATGRALSILEIAKKIANLLNKELSVVYAPPRPAEPRLLIGSYEKAKKELGWEPEYTFEEGLRETVAYYMNFFNTCMPVSYNNEGKFHST